METQIVFAVLVFSLFCHDVSPEMVKMKIVEEPSSYGVNNAFHAMYQSQSETLKARVKAANFSGPPHLRHLLGKCFTKVDNNYKYEFCPFFNLTQHEQSYRWNPYSGVLGVWQEWEIVNNTFKAMVMREGDRCGDDKFRSTKVVLTCGKENRLANVTEPERCEYLVNFTTPLVCHPQAMLVYPRLHPPLQQQWNTLLGEVEAGLRTPLGLERGLRRIFEEAGFYLTEQQKAEIKVEEKKADTESVQRTYAEFYTLDSCAAAHRRLKDENEKTKEENERLKKKVKEMESELQVFKSMTRPQSGGHAEEDSVPKQLAQQSSQALDSQHPGQPEAEVAMNRPMGNSHTQTIDRAGQQPPSGEAGGAAPGGPGSNLQQLPAGTAPLQGGNNLLQQAVNTVLQQQGNNMQQQAVNAAPLHQGNNVLQQGGNAAPLQEGNNVLQQGGNAAPFQEGNNVQQQAANTAPLQQVNNVLQQGGNAAPLQQGNNVLQQGGNAAPLQQGINTLQQGDHAAPFRQGNNMQQQAANAAPIQQGNNAQQQAVDAASRQQGNSEQKETVNAAPLQQVDNVQ